MTKFEKVEKFLNANARNFSAPFGLAKAAESELGVGIYVDHVSEYAPTRQGRSSHGFQVWYLRSGKWYRSVGWVHISPREFKAAQ